jgi:hypothetical protein
MRKLTLLFAFAIATPLAAQIADNSFLIEEAYNQESGVVQHISLFQHATRGGDWTSSFTQEWPLSGLRHQLSYTATALRVDGNGAGFGDFAINYRYQLIGDAESRVAVSPRLTIILPTGDEQQGRGAGATGVQVMLPVSTVLSPQFVAHWNLGATVTPARDSRSWTAGQSVIWLPQKRFNALVETVWTRNDFRGGSRETSLVVSPGIRWSYDFASGLQIVPGVAVPFSLRGEESRSVLVYLSFEHPFRRNR